MSDDFLSVLASCTEAASTMDMNNDDYMPPFGPYMVQIVGVETGMSEKDGIKTARIIPTFKIVDGEHKGRTFTPQKPFFIPQIQGERTWFENQGLVNLSQLATCLVNREVRDPVEAIQIVTEGKGEYISLILKSSPNKKNPGDPWRNLVFLNRLDAVVEEAT